MRPIVTQIVLHMIVRTDSFAFHCRIVIVVGGGLLPFVIVVRQTGGQTLECEFVGHVFKGGALRRYVRR